jgi:uncharacterized protein YjbI with pentapeptide repeats
VRFFPRHDWTGTCIHVGLIFVSLVFAVFSYRNHAQTLRGREQKPFKIKTSLKDRRTYYGIATAVTGLVLCIVSAGAIDGVPSYAEDEVRAEFSWTHRAVPNLFSQFGYNVFADMGLQDISSKPEDYWLIKESDRDSSIIGASLEDADLRFADMSGAFLAHARMGGANLQRADLTEANLQEVYLGGANLQGASLSGANILGANLGSTNLQTAYLSRANLQEASLYKANLGGADLFFANLREAKLTAANLRGANLAEASLDLADLAFADLKGTDLSDVRLSQATHLTQAQLDFACGNWWTDLPRFLHIRPCIYDSVGNILWGSVYASDYIKKEP